VCISLTVHPSNLSLDAARFALPLSVEVKSQTHGDGLKDRADCPLQRLTNDLPEAV
jgi:hypothetical protein